MNAGQRTGAAGSRSPRAKNRTSRFNVGRANIDNTHLVGYIDAAFTRLVEVFGEPEEGDRCRFLYRWRIAFADGTIATVYDWKATSLFCPGLPKPDQLRTNEPRRWNVGGKSPRAVRLLHRTIGDQQLSGKSEQG